MIATSALPKPTIANSLFPSAGMFAGIVRGVWREEYAVVGGGTKCEIEKIVFGSSLVGVTWEKYS